MEDFQAAVNEATFHELLVNDFGTAEKVRKPKSVMLAPLEDQNEELLKMLGEINLTLERVEGKLNQGANSVTLERVEGKLNQVEILLHSMENMLEVLYGIPGGPWGKSDGALMVF